MQGCCWRLMAAHEYEQESAQTWYSSPAGQWTPGHSDSGHLCPLDDEYTALPYGSSPSGPDSFHSTGITISSKHLGEIEQITTFTTAFDVIISSRIITVSPDRGTPQWANCKNRGLSYNPYKPPQGQPIHFDFYRHLITTVIDIFNAPKKLLDVETFNLDQVDYLRMALLKGIVSDLYAFQLSHFPEQLRTNIEVDISF